MCFSNTRRFFHISRHRGRGREDRPNGAPQGGRSASVRAAWTCDRPPTLPGAFLPPRNANVKSSTWTSGPGEMANYYAVIQYHGARHSSWQVAVAICPAATRSSPSPTRSRCLSPPMWRSRSRSTTSRSGSAGSRRTGPHTTSGWMSGDGTRRHAFAVLSRSNGSQAARP